jgi:hypothetical protein
MIYLGVWLFLWLLIYWTVGYLISRDETGWRKWFYILFWGLLGITEARVHAFEHRNDPHVVYIDRKEE